MVMWIATRQKRCDDFRQLLRGAGFIAKAGWPDLTLEVVVATQTTLVENIVESKSDRGR